MLIDSFGRIISYLRVSVTDRCNFRCTYCMPPEGVMLKPHDEILSYEEIARIVEIGASLGISKIKLTGGEPLVRPDLEQLVEMLARIPDIDDLGMTTNGSLLTRGKALRLKAAGLMRVNISLDTIAPEKFTELTQGHDIADVIRGIDAARLAGFAPVKINMVVFETTLQEEIKRMEEFCDARGLLLQTIARFNLHDRNNTCTGLSTHRPPHCNACNRLRLTADGHLLSCLFSDSKERVDLNDIHGSFYNAVAAKPQHGTANKNLTMSQIGG